MIKTITLDVCLERRIKGKRLDEIQFYIDQVNLSYSGVGIKVSQLLNGLQIKSNALLIASNKHFKFIKNNLDSQKIDSIIMETNCNSKMNMIFIDENENYDIINDIVSITNDQLTLFSSIIKDDINKEDVIVFEYNGVTVDETFMELFYQNLFNSEIQICSLNAKYWNMLKNNPANVLIFDVKQCLSYLKQERISFDQLIIEVQNNLSKFAKVLIMIIDFNAFVIFVEGKAYHIYCNLENKGYTIHYEAFLASAVKCYIEDGDLRFLSELCMSMSLGINIKNDIVIPSKNMLKFIKDNMEVKTL